MGADGVDVFDRMGLALTNEQKECLLHLALSCQAATRGKVGLDHMLEAVARLTAKDIEEDLHVELE